MTDSTRAAFEAWWNEILGLHFTRAEQFNCSTAVAFTIYQAARQSALDEAATICYSKANDWHGHDGKYACEDAAAAIRQLAAQADKRPEGEKT